MSTLIVCTANICRSPAAAALWRTEAARRSVAHPVDSAGLQAQPGREADPTCVALLAAKGVAIGAHHAQPFLAQAALRYDLILAMEPWQVRHIEAFSPVLSGRVHLLGRWGEGPIADPFGGELSGYDRCLVLMQSAVENWMDRLIGRRTARAAS